MLENELIRRSLPIIKRAYETNFASRELVLSDTRGWFRPDVTLVSNRRWRRSDINRMYYSSKPEYYDLPIGVDLRFAELASRGLSQWDCHRLIEQGLLERVRRGYYLRHQPTPVIESELVMIEFKTKFSQVVAAINQTARYSNFANVSLIVLPFSGVDFMKLGRYVRELDFVGAYAPLFMVFQLRADNSKPSNQAYVLGKLHERYARKYLSVAFEEESIWSGRNI